MDDSFNDSDDDAINMLFMLHENVILTDGKGITREVTYLLGPQFSDEILQHKVCNKNGHEFPVDGTLLSSMNAPDISTIPISVEQYANELHNLTRPTNWFTELKLYLDICTGSQMNYNFSHNISIRQEIFYSKYKLAFFSVAV